MPPKIITVTGNQCAHYREYSAATAFRINLIPVRPAVAAVREVLPLHQNCDGADTVATWESVRAYVKNSINPDVLYLATSERVSSLPHYEPRVVAFQCFAPPVQASILALWRPCEIPPSFAERRTQLWKLLWPKDYQSHNEDNDQFRNTNRSHIVLQQKSL